MSTKLTTKRRGQRAPLSRDAVIGAARDMIAELGHESLSLRPLAKRLGVTAAALYAHVEDKLDLLRAVAEGEYARAAQRYQATDSDDPIERLKHISHSYVAYARANPELFRVMFMFPPVIVSKSGSAQSAAAQQAFELAAQEVDRAMGQGKIRPGDPMLKSLSIWAAVHGAASFVLTGRDLDTDIEDKLVTTVVDNLLAGMAP